jgi:hypothetical protein
MSPRLNRAEFWLLTTAAEQGIPLRMLNLYDGDQPRHNHLEVVLNKRGHGQTIPQLARALERMHSRGWIDFQKLRGPEPRAALNDFACAIREPGNFADGWYYSLTAQGGNVWEAFARPDWDRFIEDEDEQAEGTYVRVVRAMNEHRLGRYLGMINQEIEVEPDSKQIGIVEPWRVSYWKNLPRALQCTFRCRRKTESPRFCSPASWLRSRWCDWL